MKEEHTKLQNKLDKFLDLLADGVLTREEFMHKKMQIKERQQELTEMIAGCDRIDDRFSQKLARLINITTEAYETFKGSNLEEKRQLLNFIFSNLFLNGSKLEYDLAFPFDQLAKLTNCSEWRTGWDSNPRYAFTHAGFQDQCFQPLSHLSIFYP